MKGGVSYAKKVKKLFGQLKRTYGPEYADRPTDLVEVVVLAVLSQNGSDRRARTALQRILDNTVDMNEFRVTSPGDMPSIFGPDYPDSVSRSKALARVLGEVFNRENSMDLAKVAEKSKREAREYFESLPGSSPYVAAYMVLWGLGGHAIPVDDHLAAVLRKEELVDPASEPAEIQPFLERHISAADGKVLATLLRRYATAKAPKVGKAVEVKKTGTSKKAAPSKEPTRRTAEAKSTKKKAANPK